MLDVDPKNAEVLIVRGDALCAPAEYEAAADCFGEVLRLNPRFVNAQDGLRGARLAMGRAVKTDPRTAGAPPT